MATSIRPVGMILENYGTTTVVNFISYNKAYSVFPLPTFIHHEGWYLKPRSEANERLMNKYASRGWTLRIPGSFKGNEVTNHPMQDLRRIGDWYTWSIPLDVSEIPRCRRPTEILENTCFSITKRWDCHYAISVLDHPI